MFAANNNLNMQQLANSFYQNRMKRKTKPSRETRKNLVRQSGTNLFLCPQPR